MPGLIASSGMPQADKPEELSAAIEDPQSQSLRELALPGLVKAGYRLLLPLAKGGTSEASMPTAQCCCTCNYRATGQTCTA